MNEGSKEMYQQFRRMVEKSAWIMVFLMFLIETLAAICMITQGMLTGGDTPLTYTLTYVVFPTMINMEVAAIFHFIEYKTKKSDHIKNYSLIMMFHIMCLTAAMIHNAISLLSLSFMLPVFLSAVFGDKKITRFTFIVAILFYLCSIINSIYYAGNKNFFIYLNYFSGFLLLNASYLIVRSVLIYEEKNNAILKQFGLRQMEMIEEMRKDSLTGLYNHETFYHELNQHIEKQRSNEENKTILISILDIDNFKKVNDSYGHVIGDQVLIKLSELLRSYQDDTMFLARYGGEEFCMIFIDHTMQEAYATLESMRLKFSHLQFPDMEDIRVTFSAGLVAYKQGEDNAISLVEKADAAMYEAKSTGKNKIAVYEKIETR